MARHRRIGNTFLSDPPRELELPEGFEFEHGQRIAPFRICYETFGELDASGSNAILVCHALSAGAHAAGKYKTEDEKPGWWDGMIGYGKPIDLEREFVVCVNFPGSSMGTTGPASIAPDTGKPWGSRYPWVTIADMARAEKLVLDHLGITRLRSVIGGSLGGMQVLMWATLYPEMMRSLVCMAGAAAVPVEGVAWHIIGRKIIESDHHFHGGDYYDGRDPLRGLQVARMVGHMTYLSQEALERKFGRRRRRGSSQFEIDSYLEYQGSKFSRSYDANSYLRIQAAMDEMDLEEIHGSLEIAFSRFRGRALLLSFDTDWLFPPAEVQKVHDALRNHGIDSIYHEMQSVNGHDTFLIDFQLVGDPVRKLLGELAEG
jgi:homoserine O-acetyltransferase/O-succinyltransferase